MTTEPAHAVYAPSSASRWTKCTASAEAIARYPEQESGEAAISGTEAHDEIETLLRDWRPGAPMPTVDPAHPAAYGIALVLDFLRQLPTDGASVWIEQRVTLTPQIWGRSDVAHWHAPSATLTTLDYKNGFIDVPAERNDQTRIYAGGTIFKHSLPVQWIRHVIVQPNSIVPGPRVKQWLEPAAELHQHLSRIAAIPDQPKRFVAGQHCRYCPAFGQCPATQDLLTQLQPMLAHMPDQVPADRAALLLSVEKPIEDWFKAFRKAALKSALKAGAAPDGLKIIETTKHREWTDAAAARAAIVAKVGTDALPLPTPAQAEKAGVDVSSLTTTPKGSPQLAFESDRRKAWEPADAKKMFASVVGG